MSLLQVPHHPASRDDNASFIRKFQTVSRGEDKVLNTSRRLSSGTYVQGLTCLKMLGFVAQNVASILFLLCLALLSTCWPVWSTWSKELAQSKCFVGLWTAVRTYSRLNQECTVHNSLAQTSKKKYFSVFAQAVMQKRKCLHHLTRLVSLHWMP